MQTRNLIAGEWCDSDSGATLKVANPANDELLAEVPDCGAAEVTRAVDACRAEFARWSGRTAAERARPLRALADLMIARVDELARIMTAEQGKPLAESRGEIAYAASFIEWAAGEAGRVYGETVPASAADKRILVLRQPVGVCACITPWNFPAAMIARKVGPALAAGCTMVVKPAEQTPLSALALAELALEAGVPAGALAVVTGDAAVIGKAIFADPRVRKVSFTGSTEVGRILIGQSAQNITRLSLELGGHAPFVVFDDADIDAAVGGAVANKFRNAGQTCICANRFIVHAGVRNAFVEKFTAAVNDLVVGPGDQPGVDVGPLIDDAAVMKVRSHVDDARAKGARVCIGGSLVPRREGLADRFFQPTVLDSCTPDMLLWREETFGPVAPIATFTTDEEAVRLANDSPYGLAAYFYTSSASRLMRVAEALEYGIVGANDGAPSTAQAPFGGVKHSGYGREGGRYAMHDYTEIKYVSWKI